MTVYCNVCHWKIGKVTFENRDEMRLRYAKHFVNHKANEIIGSICWTMEPKRNE